MPVVLWCTRLAWPQGSYLYEGCPFLADPLGTTLVCAVLAFAFAAVLQDISEVYLAPGLKLAREHLQPLLNEAADMQRRLAALGC